MFDAAGYHVRGDNVCSAASWPETVAVYLPDGRVLSDDPEHFEIISNDDHYLFTKDSHTVHVNGNPIVGAEPATFRVSQGAYARDDPPRLLFH